MNAGKGERMKFYELAALELKVSKAAVVMAENSPQRSLSKLRKRIIECYSEFKVVGPAFWLESK